MRGVSRSPSYPGVIGEFVPDDYHSWIPDGPFEFDRIGPMCSGHSRHLHHSSAVTTTLS